MVSLNTQNLNLVPNNPELSDVLNFFKKQVQMETNCLHVGTIQSFNATNQTANVTINYPKSFLSLTSTGDTSITTTAYPQLNGCPVFVLGGGSGAITLPISEGDECLIFFNDRDLSNWWATGSTSSPPNTSRIHGFADAIVFVGINSIPNTWLNYDDTAVTLRFGSSNTIKVNGTAATLTVGSNTIVLNDSSATVTVGSNSIALSESEATITVGSNTIVLNETQAQIKAGTATTTIGPTLTSVGNSVSTLGVLLQTLITDVTSIITALNTNAATFIAVTGGPGSPSPINPLITTALISVSSSLSTLSTEVSEVLS
jgi:hypothetical protein